ncbi:MAG: phosphatidylserine decarboxylase [Duodenibacillus sp.]|nr:phosphatidylserine decarboxylase [Duodenibacillus sp.]
MNKTAYPHPFIAREGWPFIGVAAALALIVQLTCGGFLAFVFWALLAFVVQFFRDPVREMTDDPNAVVSPVDGRVIKVEQAQCPYTGEQTQMISIFMNVFSVHSQKAPVAGQIEDIGYWQGKFFNAALDKASEQNERNAVTVVTPYGERVCFVQIAGLVARRILCYKRITEIMERGERYGFIRFGSRVDVYLPMTAEVKVAIGQKVTGVESVIARLQNPAVLPEEQ